MKYKILISTTVPGTLAYILQEQPKYLSKHFDVALVTSPGPEISSLNLEDVPVYQLQMIRGISPLKDLISIFRMISVIQRIQPDIIHSYTPKAGLVCMIAGWICRVPVRVHTFTGLIWPTARGIRRKLLITVDKLICACATHIVPEGIGVKRDLQAANVTSKPLRLIGYGNIAGVDVEYFSSTADGIEISSSSLRKLYSIQDNDFVYIFIGRLNRDKGLDELLTAFSQLPDNSRLLILGDLDKTSPISYQAMETLKNNSRIHWLGFQNDIRPALHASDILVLPSYREGFPNVVLQACAMGRPVVATDINGCNEVIEPGVNGWLVPARNAKALQKAMLESMNTPSSDLIGMGQRARELIKAKYERKEHWQRVENFYRELLTNPMTN